MFEIVDNFCADTSTARIAVALDMSLAQARLLQQLVKLPLVDHDTIAAIVGTPHMAIYRLKATLDSNGLGVIGSKRNVGYYMSDGDKLRIVEWFEKRNAPMPMQEDAL